MSVQKAVQWFAEVTSEMRRYSTIPGLRRGTLIDQAKARWGAPP